MGKLVSLFKKGSNEEGKSLGNRHKQIVKETRRLERQSAELLKMALQLRGGIVLS